MSKVAAAVYHCATWRPCRRKTAISNALHLLVAENKSFRFADNDTAIVARDDTHWYVLSG